MCGMTFLVGMGYSIIVPVLPLYVRDFGASNLEIGAVVAGFALTRTVFNLPAGVASGKIGSKNSILIGLIVVGVTSAIIGSAKNYETVLVARTVAGVGSAFYITSSVTYMAELTSKGRRGQALSIYDGTSLVGSTIGPAVGGVLAYWGGRNLPFITYACFLFAAALLVKLFLPEARKQNIERHSLDYSELKLLFSNRSFLFVNTSTFMYSFILTSMEFTIIPLFAESNVGLNSLQIGGLFTLLSLAQLAAFIPAGPLSDKFGRKPFMISSLLVMSLALTLMASTSRGGFVLTMGMLGFGSGLAGPMAAWISDLSPEKKLGIAIGLFSTLNDIGIIVGPLLLTAMTHSSKALEKIPDTPFLVGGILMTATAILLIAANDPVRGEKSRIENYRRSAEAT